MGHPRPDETAKILLARFAREEQTVHNRAQRLRQQVREAVPRAARAIGVKRVFLFGSLVWGPAFPDADVDLAVEGLSGGQLDEFAVALMGQVDGDLDVVPLEHAPESLRVRVLAAGELLYDRDAEAAP